MKPKSFTLDSDSEEILEKLTQIYGQSKSDVIRSLLLHADQNSFLEKRKANMREFLEKKERELEELQRLARERREKRIAERNEKEKAFKEKVEQRELRFKKFLQEAYPNGINKG
jgi:hypothetical protein